jgi:spore germination protein KC
MKNSKYIISMICSISVLLAGCGDRKEVDDQVYAFAIGVDKGVENKVRVTVQYPTYKEGRGETTVTDQGQALGDTMVDTIEAPSILEGINLLSISTSRRISLIHAKLIVFSESFAMEGIGEFLEPVSRYRETRRIMQIVVTNGSAEEFIQENKNFIGQSLAKSMELQGMQSDNSGYFPLSDFHTFYRRILSPYGQSYTVYAGINEFRNLRKIGEVRDPPLVTKPSLLPGRVPRRGELKNEYIGIAVFNGDIMVGTLDAYETRYFLMVVGEFRRGIMTIEDENSPGDAVVLEMMPAREPTITAHIKDGKPVINVSLHMEGEIEAIKSRYPYEEPDKIDEIDRQIEENIKNGIEKVISKVKNEYGTDIFGFGYKVARNFSTIDKFEKYDWLTTFPKAIVNVEVEANIRRTGLMIRSAPIRYNKDKKEERDKK